MNTADTGIEVLYRGRSLSGIPFLREVVNEYNQSAVELDLSNITDTVVQDFGYNIPDRYKQIDIEDHVNQLVQGQTDIIRARVENELALYKAKNLYPVLQLMIYIIDVMRQNKIVWGVGRGSSVSSYVLYLLGVHKIDSIRYDLDIHEFLR